MGGSSVEGVSLVGSPDCGIVDVGPATAALVEGLDDGLSVDFVFDSNGNDPRVLGSVLAAAARVNSQKRAAFVSNFTRAVPELNNLRVEVVGVDEDPFKGSHEAFLLKVKRVLVWVKESLVSAKEDLFPDSLIVLFP